jgi:hypothetical protein
MRTAGVCLPCSYGSSPMHLAATSALSPMLRPPRPHSTLLEWLQGALSRGSEAVVLAELMPRHWSDFIRNAPMDTVRPLGTRTATVGPILPTPPYT